jgi:hypothetical protein
MFGYSFLPISTSFTKFLNGDRDDLILYIRQEESVVVLLSLQVGSNDTLVLQ